MNTGFSRRGFTCLTATFAGWLAAVSCLPGLACSQTLHEAVSLSLKSSVAVKAEVMRLEALDEQRVQALNLRRPSVQLEGSTAVAGRTQKFDRYSKWQRTEPGVASLTFSQPLLLGGRYQASLREADLRIAQGIARIRALELSTVRDVIEAYGDVVRDTTILQIRQNGISNLTVQLKGTQARQTVGLVGLTELSQAETRLAGARGQEANARARLISSRAILDRLIGETPLGTMDTQFGFETDSDYGVGFFDGPTTLDEAIEIGINQSHEVKIARFNEEIARATARVSQVETAPRATLQAGLSGTSDTNFNGSRTIDTSVTARFVIPLWSGGQPQSRVRAALATANAARMDGLELEQKLRARIINAWADVEAAHLRVESAHEQVRASLVALTGARLEQKIGARSILEVLNQEQEFLEAKVSLASARRDVLVNHAILMTLIGFDPTKVVTRETEFDPSKLAQSPFKARVGRPQKWEKPWIRVHDRLLDFDTDAGHALRSSVKVILGPEE